jgi:DNA-binding CsgD family transcriptional regulator
MERYGRKLSGPPELTEREAEIARLLVREYPRKAIGPNLMMSEKTVGNHIDSMQKKFGAHENIGILRGLISMELIAPDDLKRRYWVDKGAGGAGDGQGKTPLRLAPSKSRGAYADLERAE